MFKRFVVVTAVSAVLFCGCSDDGDTPTGGGGGGAGPSLSVGDVKVLEGQTVQFTISLDGAASQDISFGYTTVDGDATSSSDFTMTSGRDTIFAGASSTTISVATTNDAIIEFAETFGFVIRTPVNATIGDATGTATIYDEDGVRFSSDVNPLIQSQCASAGCHGSSTGGFTLSNNNAAANYNSIVNGSANNGRVVVKRNAAASNLYLKLLDPPPFGLRMPRGGPPYLSSSNIQLIRDWINQDAQDN